MKKVKKLLVDVDKLKISDSEKLALRKKQFDVAMQGNVQMLIWLGKQYLEQSDTQDQLQNVRPIDGIDFEGI
tara:strand:+ start:1306 stop:1521 length:216 start_codon:yes stop_codon:yes gene_type:complete